MRRLHWNLWLETFPTHILLEMLRWVIWLYSQQRMSQTLHLLRYIFLILVLLCSGFCQNVYGSIMDAIHVTYWLLIIVASILILSPGLFSWFDSDSSSSPKWLQPTSSKLGSVRILFGWPRMKFWNIFLSKLNFLTKWSSANSATKFNFQSTLVVLKWYYWWNMYLLWHHFLQYKLT